MFAVADDAGGIGEIEIDDEDLGDDENGSQGGESEPDEKDKRIQELTDKLNKLEGAGEKLEKLEKAEKARSNQEAVEVAVTEIKGRYPDFDPEAVEEYLNELHKTDPEKAEALNNPIGWENVYHQIKPLEPAHDEFNLGENIGGEDQSEEIFKKVKTEGTVSLQEQAAVLDNL